MSASVETKPASSTSSTIRSTMVSRGAVQLLHDSLIVATGLPPAYFASYRPPSTVASNDDVLWRDIWGVTHIVYVYIDVGSMKVLGKTTGCGLTVMNRFSEFLYARVVHKPAHPTCLTCIRGWT